MLANAGKQFGQNSGRLIQQYQRSPRVHLDDLKIIGVVPDERTPDQPGPGH
jgi:hypothetical protein